MKIICNKNALSEGINIVQNAVSQRTSLQVLEGILINAGKDLILTGNDLEIGIETKISAEILEEGRIVINSRIFSDLIRKLPERDVTIEIKNNDTVVIDSEKIHYEVKGMNPDTYPAIQNVNKEKKIIIEQKKLKEMIRKTIFAVSQDESRPVLMGSLLEFDKERITLVSIDGFRLAMRKEETEQENINDGKVIIPGNTLSDVQKIIQENDEKINIYTEKKQIMFEMSNTKIVSRLIEGEYLNYKGIIPQEFETKISIEKNELLSAMERALLIIPNDDKRYPVIINIKDDILYLNARTDIGTIDEEISVDMEGKEIEIGFNPRYFIDALKSIEETEIEICFTTEAGPCIIKSLDNEKYIHMLLPVRR